jgi:hypothetical protein
MSSRRGWRRCTSCCVMRSRGLGHTEDQEAGRVPDEAQSGGGSGMGGAEEGWSCEEEVTRRIAIRTPSDGGSEDGSDHSEADKDAVKGHQELSEDEDALRRGSPLKAFSKKYAQLPHHKFCSKLYEKELEQL